MRQSAERYHDISCGHRVAGHESKCAMLHGHNYRVHFTCEAEEGMAPTDQLGRVIDFSEIKKKLCEWLEENWDHRFLAWANDPVLVAIHDMLNPGEVRNVFDASLVWVPFNPTAENMAAHLLNIVGPDQLRGTGIRLTKVLVEETRKCSAGASLT